MTAFYYILLSCFFVLLNAFFVAAEFSIVKIRHTRVETLQQNAGLRGRILAKVHYHLDTYLSACQLGITLASLGLGWIGEPAFANLFQAFFQKLQIDSPATVHLFSFIFAFTLISYLHIVAGELMPKSMAIRQTERMALWTALPLYLFYWLMCPIISLFNSSANMFLKLFKLDTVQTENITYSSDEIKLILKMSHRYGDLSKSELDLLTKSLIFIDLEISDVMRPLSEIVAININQDIKETIQMISQQRYSRYPVYKDDVSNIIGVLHVKDLIPSLQEGKLITSITPFLRAILKVKENEFVLDLFHKFRTGKSHFAIVFIEKKAIGFVTLDNLLQAIMGEIKDEFHITKEDWILLEDGSFIIKGVAPIFTLETLLGIEITDTQANTISGLILEKLQSFPKEGEKIVFDEFTIVVKKVRGPRILQIRVYPHKKATPNGSSLE